jgi:hypothetical protein
LQDIPQIQTSLLFSLCLYKTLVQISGEVAFPSVIFRLDHPLLKRLLCFLSAVALICFQLIIKTRIIVVKRWQWDVCVLNRMVVAIFHLGVVTRGTLYSGCGKHQWKIGVDRLINKSVLQVWYF